MTVGEEKKALLLRTDDSVFLFGECDRCKCEMSIFLMTKYKWKWTNKYPFAATSIYLHCICGFGRSSG